MECECTIHEGTIGRICDKHFKLIEQAVEATQEDCKLLACAWYGVTPDRNTMSEEDCKETERLIEATASKYVPFKVA